MPAFKNTYIHEEIEKKSERIYFCSFGSEAHKEPG